MPADTARDSVSVVGANILVRCTQCAPVHCVLNHHANMPGVQERDLRPHSLATCACAGAMHGIRA